MALDKRGIAPQDLMHTGEVEYKEHIQGKDLSRNCKTVGTYCSDYFL